MTPSRELLKTSAQIRENCEFTKISLAKIKRITVQYIPIIFFRSLYDNKIQTLMNGTFTPLKNIQTL